MDPRWAALAPKEFLQEALKEARWRGLEPDVHGNLLLFQGNFEPLAWAAVHWRKVRLLQISSISDGARQLKALAKRWRFCSLAHHRRGVLILEQLREPKRLPLEFPSVAGAAEEGVFSLLAPDLLVVGQEFDRPDPEGVLLFQENKSAPSRAYLKLWEALTLAGKFPQPGEQCLDLGSSPGGWTWVAAELGARVLSVDRSPLASSVGKMPGVEFRSGDAFQMLPDQVGEVDWLFSDVICYPEKLLGLVRAWVDSGKARNMICTIKFQGEADPAWIDKFQALGRVLHLHHNKHELTWMRVL